MVKTYALLIVLFNVALCQNSFGPGMITEYGKGCAMIDTAYGCTSCYKRKMSQDRFGKYNCDGEEMEDNYHCDIHGLNGFSKQAISCLFCVPGYAKYHGTACWKMEIPRCVSGTTTIYDAQKCHMCDGGFVESNRCGKFADIQPDDERYPFAQNCVWGNHRGCSRCELGYIQIDKKCVAASSLPDDSFTGCHIGQYDSKGKFICTKCNVWEDYTSYLSGYDGAMRCKQNRFLISQEEK